MAAKKTKGSSVGAARTSASAGKSSATGTRTTKSATTARSTTKTAATKATAKKASGTTTKKATAAKKAGPQKAPAKKSPARKSTATKATAKKAAAPTKGAASKKAGSKAAALRVRDDESPWTAGELDDVRATLLEEQNRLRGELAYIENDIQQLMRDSGDGSGDDDVDTGAKTSEREQEFTVARNSTAMLEQGARALQAIEDGTYGVCESCGKPIGKLRLQAQPRATLCVTCKQQQERR